MKRTSLATLGITLGLATMTYPALAQSLQDAPADFGPPAPGAMQDPALASPPAGDLQVQVAPAPSTSEPAPAAIDVAPSASIVEAPAAPVEERDAYATTTRRAAPDRLAPRDRHEPNPQTGHYLGHGLFNNWGPNDFGA